MMSTPFRRGLAVFLCAQPILWMSHVALAQTVQLPQTEPGTSAAPAPVPPAPTLPSPAQSEQTRADQGRAETGRPIPLVPPAPAVDEPIDPERYVCGPGDGLEADFWGLQNFKLRLTVDLEGRVFVPRVGFFQVQGKTLAEARRMMRDGVARYFPRLNFELALLEPRTFLIHLADDVAKPGAYSARAVDRLSTVIERSGGFGPGASVRRIEVRRRGGVVMTVDLLRYAQTGDVNNNPYLLDGDVIRVPFEDLAASAGGAVNRPGRYELVGARDLAELVDVAGGLAPTVTRKLPIRIVRRSADDHQQQQLVDWVDGGLPVVKIAQNDNVSIPTVWELQQAVTVVGAVAGATPPVAAGNQAPDEASATKRLPFVEGDTVRTLLERVGGVGPLADLTHSYILRDGKTLPLDLYALVMLRDFKADRPVALGDSLVIPFKRRNVLVEGAVFTPGSYPYNPSFGLQEYLALAGGPSRNAQPVDNTKVITPNGVTHQYSPDVQIEPGSSVVVPERDFSRSEVVQIVISVLGVVVSGVAVFIAASK